MYSLKNTKRVEQSKIRENTIYYSDQLEIICETESLSVSWFTDNIAVIQEWFEGTVVKEFEVFLFGNQKKNEELLLNLFKQVILI